MTSRSLSSVSDTGSVSASGSSVTVHLNEALLSLIPHLVDVLPETATSDAAQVSALIDGCLSVIRDWIRGVTSVVARGNDSDDDHENDSERDSEHERLDIDVMTELLIMRVTESYARVRVHRAERLPPRDAERARATGAKFMSFLARTTHFLTTRAVGALFDEVVASSGVLFLFDACVDGATAARCLAFVAAHASHHVTSRALGTLMKRGHSALLLQSPAGCHCFRQLSHAEQLEFLLAQLVQTATAAAAARDAQHVQSQDNVTTNASTSTSTVSSCLCLLEAVSSRLVALDFHSLYRVCTLTDPASGALPPSSLDTHSRIVLIETHIRALIAINNTRSHTLTDKATYGDTEAGSGSESDSEESNFYSRTALHSALLKHSGEYRVWLILNACIDAKDFIAAAKLFEARKQFADALDARLNDAQKRVTATVDELVGWLDSHVRKIPQGAEQARSLQRIFDLYHQSALPTAPLELALLERLYELATSLRAALSRSSIQFSARLHLALAQHRLESLHAQHAAAMPPSHAAATRVTTQLLQNLALSAHDNETRAVSVTSSHTALSFSCGHELDEASLAAATATLKPRLRDALGCGVTAKLLSQQYGRALVPSACPSCAAQAVEAQYTSVTKRSLSVTGAQYRSRTNSGM